jgi:hypothetical protein
MGGKRRVGGVVDKVIEQLVRETEADIEKCLRRGYALIIGDGNCVLTLFVRSGVVEDEVSFLSYPSVAVVRKDSPQYANVIKFVGDARSPNIIMVWREGHRCSYETYSIIMEGAEREIAREFARLVVGMAVRDTSKTEELMKDGVCREERECIEYMKAHSVVAGRGCD